MSELRRTRQQIIQELDQFLLSYYQSLQATVPSDEARQMLADVLHEKQQAYGLGSNTWNENDMEQVKQQVMNDMKQASDVERVELRDELETIRACKQLMNERMSHT